MRTYLPISEKAHRKEAKQFAMKLKGAIVKGKTLLFVSNHDLVLHKASQNYIETHLGGPITKCTCRGMASNFKTHGTYLLYMKCDLDVKTFLAVLAHECSHIVDYIIGDYAIEKVDTEIRAYLLDYVY